MLKALAQLFQKRDSGKLAEYLQWREVIFSATSAQVDVVTDLPDIVYGVVVDLAHSDDFIITITAFPTGESSLRTTIGGGAIGLGSNDLIAEYAKHIVKLAQSLVDEAKSINNHNLPKANIANFYFLTTSGLRLSTFTISDIESQRNHPFYEMFKRFLVIKAQSDELTKASRNKQASK